MKKKLNVGIIFGGRSTEHEISVLSAKNIYDAMDKSKYDIVLIGITKDGKWLANPDTNDGYIKDINIKNTDAAPEKRLDSKKGSSIESDCIAETNGIQEFICNEADLPEKNMISKLDIVFPILHGPYGEDGTVQGLLKLAGLPFVGTGVLGSAVGMDKEVMKKLLESSKLPYADYKVLHKYTDDKPNPGFEELVESLGLPFFLKPANAGSSVGISKVYDRVDFDLALEKGFMYDNKLIVETFIKGREIECAVLGNERPVASIPGEVISNHDFYSYEAKYLDEKGAVLEIPAKLDGVTVEKIQKMAILTYKAMHCEGMTRVDFFLSENNEIIINEVNTIPGFTRISMYPKLWEASGISYSELIDRLIELAIIRHEREMKLKTSIDFAKGNKFG